MDILDWEEVIDETVEDGVVWIVWIDVNEEEGIEVEYVVDFEEVIDETVESNVDWCSEVENELMIVDVVTLFDGINVVGIYVELGEE